MEQKLIIPHQLGGLVYNLCTMQNSFDSEVLQFPYPRVEKERRLPYVTNQIANHRPLPRAIKTIHQLCSLLQTRLLKRRRFEADLCGCGDEK